MKKILNPIFLPVFIDSCSDETSAQLGTGTIKECLEGLTTKLFLGLNSHRFVDIDAFKDKSVWEAAIDAKEIVPLYDVYEVASDNTDAIKYETGNFVYTTKKEVKKMTSESYLSLCSHRAYKSYENSDYTQIYEATEKKEIIGVYDDDLVQVKGQDMSDFDVAIRERPTNDKPAYSMITVTFRDFEELEDKGIIVQTDWDPNKLNGVFALSFNILSSTDTEITFEARISCGANTYDAIVDEAMLSLLDSAGDPQVIASLDNTNGVYTITGVGLVSGTLGSSGINNINGLSFEALPVPVVII